MLQSGVTGAERLLDRYYNEWNESVDPIYAEANTYWSINLHIQHQHHVRAKEKSMPSGVIKRASVIMGSLDKTCFRLITGHWQQQHGNQMTQLYIERPTARCVCNLSAIRLRNLVPFFRSNLCKQSGRTPLIDLLSNSCAKTLKHRQRRAIESTDRGVLLKCSWDGNAGCIDVQETVVCLPLVAHAMMRLSSAVYPNLLSICPTDGQQWCATDDGLSALVARAT